MNASGGTNLGDIYTGNRRITLIPAGAHRWQRIRLGWTLCCLFTAWRVSVTSTASSFLAAVEVLAETEALDWAGALEAEALGRTDEIEGEALARSVAVGETALAGTAACAVAACWASSTGLRWLAVFSLAQAESDKERWDTKA